MRLKGLLEILFVTFFTVMGLASCSDDENGSDEPDNVKAYTTVSYTVYDVKVDYFIDAADKSSIESDLSANRPLPEGTQYCVEAWNYHGIPLAPKFTLEIVNGEDTTTVGEIETSSGALDAPHETFERFWQLPPEENVGGYKVCEVRSDAELIASYHLFFHNGIPGGNGEGSIIYLYEDLTDKYLEKFPTVRINAVVRRQTLTFNKIKVVQL